MRNVYVAVTYTGSPNVTRTFSLYPDDTGEGRLMSPLNYKASVRTWIQQDRSTGAVSNVILANADGLLDDFVDEEFVDLEISEDVDGTTTQLAYGLIDRVFVNGQKTVTIKLKDATKLLDVPVQDSFFPTSEISDSDGSTTNTYYGLEGQPRPMLIGTNFSIKPVLLNRSINEYMCHDSDIYLLRDVYDRGVVVTDTPTTNGFTLASDPDGVIVCDCDGEENVGGTNRIRKIDDIVEYIMDRIGVTAFNSTDLSDIDTDKNYSYLYYQDNTVNRTAREVLKLWFDSIAGWFYADADGDIRFGMLKEPEVNADVELSRFNVVGGINVFDDTAPNITTKFGGNRNSYVYPSDDIAASATAQDTIDLASQWRTVYDGSSTLDPFYTDTKIIHDTWIQGNVYIEGEADSITSLYSQKRRFYTFESTAIAEIGETVELTYPRHGLDAGVNLLCVGKEIDFINNTYRLTLWG
jgi:hypothetical protein